MQKILLKFNGVELRLNIRDEADQSVMREIFKFREYKSAEESIFVAKDPILDIGAHVGFFSMYCRALNPKVKIFAVEPASENLEMLNSHIKENKLKNIIVAECAVSGKTGKRLLEKDEETINYRLSPKFADLKKCSSIKTETYSFRDFCAKNEIKKISLMKMDIEGGEYEVLESMSSEDFALVKFIILEYHNSRSENFRELENILRENGFSVQSFPSKFDKSMGFLFAINKRHA
ncbi:FkbM family methyltransferase [Patescibacteria group bacterium]|nr:FkbM family methyltransferase [Patescibacteria group bacterium]